MEAENWKSWKKKVRLGWRPEMKKNEKKLLGTAIFGCLFTGKDRRSIHEWMNEWMKTRNDRNGDRVWKCTSVNDPCLQVYLQCGGLKWRKMEKKNISYTHKCELLIRIGWYLMIRNQMIPNNLQEVITIGISLCELLGISFCELLGMTQLRIIRYYHFANY